MRSHVCPVVELRPDHVTNLTSTDTSTPAPSLDHSRPKNSSSGLIRVFACAYQCLATRLNDWFGEIMMIEGHSPVKLVELVLRTGGDAG